MKRNSALIPVEDHPAGGPKRISEGGAGGRRGQGGDELAKGDRTKVRTSSHTNEHDCSKSKECIPDWDMLGCIELYRLQHSEKLELLRSKKICFACGVKFKRNETIKTHICDWSGKGKLNAQCTDATCDWSAIMCNKHPKGGSDVLKNWLRKHGVRHTFNMLITSPIDQQIHSKSLLSKKITKQKLKHPSGKFDKRVYSRE